MASFETLTKIPLYVGLLLLTGLCSSIWLSRRPGAPERAVSSLRASTLGILASLLVVACLIARLVAHTYSTFGGDGMTWASLSTIASESRWGIGWRRQLIAASWAVGFSALARRGSVAAMLPLALVTVWLAASYSMTGHAAALSTTRLASTVHLLAAGGWFGTLFILLRVESAGILWTRFSWVALAGSALVVVSGLVMAATYFSAAGDLVSTNYGRVFLLKMALFAGTALCGCLNWRRVRTTGAPAMARLELALVLALIIVTAFLTEIAHP
ncbi:MAG: CopD family protein [Vicinamibacterales bacterium]